MTFTKAQLETLVHDFLEKEFQRGMTWYLREGVFLKFLRENKVRMESGLEPIPLPVMEGQPFED